VVFAFSVPVDAEPLVATAPVKLPPDAVHAVALVDDQVRVAALPAPTVVGLAASVAVGWGVTATVRD
jgi:hypothetical protein